MTEVIMLPTRPFEEDGAASPPDADNSEVTYLDKWKETRDRSRTKNAIGAAVYKIADHPKFAEAADSSRKNDEPAIVRPIRLPKDHDDSRYDHDREHLDKAYETIDTILERHKPYGDATLDVREFLAYYVCNARLSGEPEYLIERHVEELIALSVHFERANGESGANELAILAQDPNSPVKNIAQPEL